MRTPAILIGLFLTALGGCQSLPHPAPGLAALRVKVIAEPKAGTVSPRVSAYDTSSDLGHGAFERVDYSDLHDIVVWLEPVDAKSPAPSAPAAIDLSSSGDSSAGISAVASVGQKIVFHNVGSVALGAYSVSDGNDFNLGTIPPGGAAEAVVKSEGLVEILTDVRAEPISRVYVAPSPWVSLAKSGANVDFNNIPPGRYRIVSWHPRLPGSVTEVTLFPDQVVSASITVGVNRLPKIDSK